MNIQTVTVPKGIRYLSEWPGFSLPDHPCIIDKKLTGCGFTEYVLTQPFSAVLISPRKMLVKNKVDQHNPKDLNGNEIPAERVIYYAKSLIGEDLSVDKDLQRMPSSLKGNKKDRKKTAEDIELEKKKNIELEIKFKNDLKDAISLFIAHGKFPKICVTYDSFRKVKEVLQEIGLINNFWFVVDEFQSIFTDSRFKPDTEIEFVTQLQDLQKVSFVSATPYMEDYLDELEEFKYLPYYELDWESQDHNRVISPEIVAKSTRNINEVAKKIFTDFKNKKYQVKSLIDNYGNPIKVVEAKELVFYVNSVKNICDIIRQNKLTVDDTDVICADTAENRKKVRDAFSLVYRELGRSIKELPKAEDIISSVPIPDPITGEVRNKPVILCTKTVYLGADFYSKCARSIVLSDAAIESLAVDITLDLPQILGRQRDMDNPWKNSLEIWFRLGSGAGDISPKEFQDELNRKTEITKSLLRSYENASDGEDKHNLAMKYLKALNNENYRDDYVAVNKHKDSDICPQFNNLVMIAEKRAFDIQQLDYKDRVSVFNRISQVFGDSIIDLSQEIFKMNDEINSYRLFRDKIKCACKWVSEKGDSWINQLDDPYRTYIHSLGLNFIIANGGEKWILDDAMVKRGMGRIFSKEDLEEVILGYFQVGERYSKKQIKSDLGKIYSELGIVDKPKSTDLEKWFELRRSIITTPEGKKVEGYEIIKQK